MRNSCRWLSFAAIFLLAFNAWAIDSSAAFTDPAMQARYEHLIGELRCPKCQNETIADSPVGISADLRRAVREQMAAGKSDAEIRRYMTDRFGDFILYKPPFVERTWLLWLAPAIAIVIGLLTVGAVIRRRSHFKIDDEDTLDAVLDENKRDESNDVAQPKPNSKAGN